MMSGTTEPRPVPIRPSDEGDRRGLELARAEGEAYGRTLAHMTDEVAHDGGAQPAGPYLVGYAVEKAEGMYHLVDGELRWEEPEKENVHVEIAVRDAADGRFVPGLGIEVTLLDGGDTAIGTYQLPLLWHPYLYHYGRNCVVPGDGEYTLRVRIAPPEFMRHDEVNGKRFAEEVRAEFRGVKIKAAKE
jgi:hypothetical protein